ncbi:L,D-transpeptidase [Paenibacillus herberti]|uniref:L,D-TPase catalytic domain-containing protein n=1 Tax=Paenibacillus herberti TaxID=1619309 RepID=A0A229P486_9BACL|nr:L,D-transpeptidase [Paenibacillus herberti]OXM16887.1 hypothetical protein CGZ75_09630 [Paenibacillus herberti]
MEGKNKRPEAAEQTAKPAANGELKPLPNELGKGEGRLRSDTGAASGVTGEAAYEAGVAGPTEALQEAALERRLEELKKYVTAHSHNKMAWFLLGKTYARLGKEAKANYCYLRSGPIYEAYENSPHPYENSLIPAEELLSSWNEEPRRGRIAARIGLAVLAGLLLIPAASSAPGNRPVQEAATVKGRGEEPQPGVVDQQRENKPSAVVRSTTEQGMVWVDGPAFASGAVSAAESLRLTNKWNQVAALTLPRAGKHYRWELPAVGAASASRTERAGSYLLQEPVSQDMCNCESGLSESVDNVVKAERLLQEQRWSVISGIRSYYRINGKWPKSLADLTRPYPNNILAGKADGMERLFAEMLVTAHGSETSKGGGTKVASQENGSSEKVQRGKLASAMSESLRIVVDVKTHRLALLSGSVVVRVYPVGLGGAKTPLGQYAISEKVRNPNGTTKGPFSSRGMTLSDTRYAIHATNDLDSISKDESLGCVRIGRQDAEELYDLVPIGTPVTIQAGGLEHLKPQEASQGATKSRYKVRPVSTEENPNKVYNWLL